MKLAAIAARGRRKDFLDLWVLITRREALSRYVEDFRAKYAPRDIGHLLRSLVYFDDAEGEPELRLLIDLDWAQVKADYRRWVAELLDMPQK